MANDNYRMKVQVGKSGTKTNPSGLQLDYTDDVLSNVTFVAEFPSKAGLPYQEVTLSEDAGQITVDRSALTITVPFPRSTFADILTDGRKGRRGWFAVASDDGGDNNTDILRGVIVAEGTTHSRYARGTRYYT